MNSLNSVSIIIIHYGSVALTQRLVQSLLEHAKDPADYQIVIVDNGSPTRFPESFQSGIATEVRRVDPGLGYGAAVNLGRTLCRHEAVLILNNDLIFRTDVPRLLRQYWNEWSRFEKMGFLGPGVYFPDGRFQLSWGYDPSLWSEFWEKWTQKAMQRGGGGLYWLRRILSRNPRRVDWISGVAMMTTKTVFDLMGGFDGKFPFYFEDSDFCRRVRLAGHAVIYEPRVKIVHELGGAQVSDPGAQAKLSPNQVRIFKLRWQGHLEYYRRYRTRFEYWVLSRLRSRKFKEMGIESDF